MARYSGRFGSMNGVSQLSSWSFDCTNQDNAQANSYTKAGKMRDKSILDWTGNVTFLGKVFPGSFGSNAFALALYSGAAAWGAAGTYIHGNAVWTSINIACDISSGGRITTTVQFGGDGGFDATEDGANTDTVSPLIFMAHEGLVKFGNASKAFRSFNFTITNEVQTYVGSDTVDANHKCWTKRYPGLIDCTGTIDIVDDKPLANPGDVISDVELLCDNTSVLKIGYLRYMSTTGYTVDPSSGALVSNTGNYSMMAHGDDGTIGDLHVWDNGIWPMAAAGN